MRLTRLAVALMLGAVVTIFAASPALAAGNVCHLPQSAGVGSGYLGTFDSCLTCQNNVDTRAANQPDSIFYCTYHPANGKTDEHGGNNGYTGCALPTSAGPGSGYSRNYLYCQDCYHVAINNDRGPADRVWYCTFNPSNGRTDLHYG